ncbi:DENN domain containing protein 2D, putative [Entamoeba invadens IP1]|uniref:DENN domain containing protein 2D, putative n=1 Tax=Entamoeba invadens IP1 TaxID=370355 RepID=UPI0002C3CF38|nr:DENN domain containing protein 2D, putative [Entamoeba invadens IP1]ELP93834.1 DENN domain containing protein 2D, putative [Entamoeba invadens IP1]|eukprot:XP_004260605.1 DENN domain containing protein 2D, putative [Entamoeba invadens IP1]
MPELLVEDIIILRCVMQDNKLTMKCLYQHVKDDIDQQKTVFPFCFSEGDSLMKQRSLLKEPTTTEFFTFMLTDMNGTRKHAYCLRFPHFEQPECVCIVGKSPQTQVFVDIFKIVEKLRLRSLTILKLFLDDICLQNVPVPNGVLSNINFHHTTYQIINSSDVSSNSNHDILKLISVFGASMLVDLVGYLLVERKFLFVSQSIQVLSETVMAFTSLITPFQWQHVFIPVLPVSLLTYCSAPMPYVIGIKNAFLENVFKECGSMDDTIILDADNGKILNLNKIDFDAVFVSEEAMQLKSALYSIFLEYYYKRDESEMAEELRQESNNLIYKCFAKYLASIFGTYNKSFEFDKVKQKMVFNFEGFLNGMSPYKDKYQVIKKFEESQMRFMFFVEREEQLAKNFILEDICPLLQDYSTFNYPCETVKSIFSLLATDVKRVYCKFCYEEISPDQSVAFFEKQFYHVNCFRCSCCGRVIIGDKLTTTDELKCMMCMNIDPEKLSDEALCTIVGVNFKKRKKLLKDELIIAEVKKEYTPSQSKKQNRVHTMRQSMNFSSLKIKQRTNQEYSKSEVINPAAHIERASSPKFTQKKPQNSDLRDSRKSFFLERRMSNNNVPQSPVTTSPVNSPTDFIL